MIESLRRSRRGIFCAGIFTAGLVGAIVTGALGAHSAFAGYVICRTDPTVTLSSGAVVSMSATVQTDARNIDKVIYVLHVPKNVSITSETFDQYGYKEAVKLKDDQKINSYLIETTVLTKKAGVPFSASASLTDGDTATTSSADGISGDGSMPSSDVVLNLLG